MSLRTIEAFLTIAGRATILAILLAGMWVFGVDGPRTSFWISIACVGLVPLAVIVVLIRRHTQTLPIGLPIAACLILGFATIQSVDISALLPESLFSEPSFNDADLVGTSTSESGYASGTIASLDDGLAKSNPDAALLREKVKDLDHASPQVTISQLPSMTQMSTATLACGVVLLFVSAIVFDSSRSRKVFSIVIVGNALAMVAWGFVQRSNGNAYLVLGIEHLGHGIPFAGFIYKNAGAAALYPAIAVLASLLFFRDRVTQQDFYGENSTYGGSTDFLEVRNLIMASGLVCLLAGMATTYCRGAWGAIGASFALAMVMNFRFRIVRSGIIFAVGACTLLVGLVWFLGSGIATSDRIADLSVERVASDSRWSHWPDGWNLAMSELPFGSGLGTYRYATLPHQTEVHGSWYQYAHNQYLETFAELGLVGCLLLGFSIGWILWHVNRVRRDGATREDRRWGMVAMVVVVAGMLHSSIDFVLVLAPNLFLFAAFLGTVLSVPLRPTEHANPMALSVGWLQAVKTGRFPRFAIAVMLIAIVPASAMGLFSHQRQLQSQTALDATRLPSDRPTEMQVRDAIATLDIALKDQSQNAELLHRRFHWHLISSRSAILEISRRQGQVLTWKQTHPANLYVALASADPAARSQLCDELWSSEEFSRPTTLAVCDLRNALTYLPFHPHYHLSAAHLSPMINASASPASLTLKALSNNSHDLMYQAGIVAIFNKDVDLAVDCWQRSLSINSEHAESIYQFAAQRVPQPLIAEKLTPRSRLYTILRMVPVDQFRAVGSANQASKDLIDEIILAIESRNDLDSATKHSVSAQIRSKFGDTEAAVEAWRLAVQDNRRHAGYRYQYAVALNETNEVQQALDQASLGLVMSANSGKADQEQRLEELIARLRVKISSGYSPHQPNPYRRH